MKMESIPPFVWGIAVGAIALFLATFWAGWVETKTTVRAKLNEMAEN